MVFSHLIKSIVQHLDVLKEENKQQLGINETLQDEREWRCKQNPLTGTYHRTGNHEYNILYIMALPSPLAGCWWWEDWLEDSSVAQVELRQVFVILNFHPWALQHFKSEPQPLQLRMHSLLFLFLKKQLTRRVISKASLYHLDLNWSIHLRNERSTPGPWLPP